MLESAVRLMQGGVIPSVTQVAEEAEVSRATAYRYFPTQAALVHAVVDEALGPILDWSSPAEAPRERMKDLLGKALPRMEEFEATFRAALRHALDQWPQRGEEGEVGEVPFKRGHRRDLLADVLGRTNAAALEGSEARLAKALSLVFGVESIVILKDIWGCDSDETRAVVAWAADALIRAADAEGAKR